MDDQPIGEEPDLDAWIEYASQRDPEPEGRPGLTIDPRRLAITVTVLGVAIVVGLVLLWPGGGFRDDTGDIGGFLASDVYAAEVAEVAPGPCEGCIDVTFRLTEGPDSGTLVVNPFGGGPAVDFAIGDEVVLGFIPDSPEGFEYQYLDRQRRPVLLWIALAFAIAVVLLGRLRGLTALAGLAASVVVLLWFVLPAILDGRQPLLVAIVGAGAIAYLALFLAHGFTTLTLVALLGTLGALAMTAVLSAVTVVAAEITGFASEESLYLTVFSQDLDFQGLVLAGIVLGALGALDDVTVTQASAVAELRKADSKASPRELTKSGLRIGRDHIASTVNTLLLAYAGAALPLLVLFVLSRQSLGTVANSEAVAIEIIRTMVGSIGLVAAVPITTWLAARTRPAAK